jgi:hypothetical protein
MGHRKFSDDEEEGGTALTPLHVNQMELQQQSKINDSTGESQHQLNKEERKFILIGMKKISAPLQANTKKRCY